MIGWGPFYIRFDSLSSAGRRLLVPLIGWAVICLGVLALPSGSRSRRRLIASGVFGESV
jgi:hypothetical protein